MNLLLLNILISSGLLVSLNTVYSLEESSKDITNIPKAETSEDETNLAPSDGNLPSTDGEVPATDSNIPSSKQNVPAAEQNKQQTNPNPQTDAQSVPPKNVNTPSRKPNTQKNGNDEEKRRKSKSKEIEEIEDSLISLTSLDCKKLRKIQKQIKELKKDGEIEDEDLIFLKNLTCEDLKNIQESIEDEEEEDDDDDDDDYYDYWDMFASLFRKKRDIITEVISTYEQTSDSSGNKKDHKEMEKFIMDEDDHMGVDSDEEDDMMAIGSFFRSKRELGQMKHESPTESQSEANKRENNTLDMTDSEPASPENGSEDLKITENNAKQGELIGPVGLKIDKNENIPLENGIHMTIRGEKDRESRQKISHELKGSIDFAVNTARPVVGPLTYQSFRELSFPPDFIGPIGSGSSLEIGEIKSGVTKKRAFQREMTDGADEIAGDVRLKDHSQGSASVETNIPRLFKVPLNYESFKNLGLHPAFIEPVGPRSPYFGERMPPLKSIENGEEPHIGKKITKGGNLKQYEGSINVGTISDKPFIGPPEYRKFRDLAFPRGFIGPIGPSSPVELNEHQKEIKTNLKKELSHQGKVGVVPPGIDGFGKANHDFKGSVKLEANTKESTFLPEFSGVFGPQKLLIVGESEPADNIELSDNNNSKNKDIGGILNERLAL